MLYDLTNFVLNDGKVYTFRTPELADAKQCADFINRVAKQTPYLSRCELDKTVETDEECKWIESHRNNPNSCLICVYDKGKQIASADIKFKTLAKCQHVGEVGICIDYCYWDRGIGTQLFSEFFKLSRERGVELLTLWVVGNNDRAKHLYRKFGFQQFGLLPGGFKYQDKYWDLAFMVAHIQQQYQDTHSFDRGRVHKCQRNIRPNEC